MDLAKAKNWFFSFSGAKARGYSKK